MQKHFGTFCHDIISLYAIKMEPLNSRQQSKTVYYVRLYYICHQQKKRTYREQGNGL